MSNITKSRLTSAKTAITLSKKRLRRGELVFGINFCKDDMVEWLEIFHPRVSMSKRGLDFHVLLAVDTLQSSIPC
jgi:hypothetical protein